MGISVGGPQVLQPTVDEKSIARFDLNQGEQTAQAHAKRLLTSVNPFTSVLPVQIHEGASGL